MRHLTLKRKGLLPWVLLTLPVAVIIGLKYYDQGTGDKAEQIFDDVFTFSLEGLFITVGFVCAVVALGFMGYLLWRLLKFAALALYVVVKRFSEWAQRELDER